MHLKFITNFSIYNFAFILYREGMELIYNRLPWQEPDAPHIFEILYEDDDLVSRNIFASVYVLFDSTFHTSHGNVQSKVIYVKGNEAYFQIFWLQS